MNRKDFKPHPEGGSYREVYRSAQTITAEDGRRRVALSHIDFALETGEVSRFHRVVSDEVWNLYAGSGVRLVLWDGGVEAPTVITLSAEAGCSRAVVPAGCWQAAEPLGAPVLVGCTVAPGFEYRDFELIAPDSEAARQLLAFDPGLARFIS